MDILFWNCAYNCTSPPHQWPGLVRYLNTWINIRYVDLSLNVCHHKRWLWQILDMKSGRINVYLVTCHNLRGYVLSMLFQWTRSTLSDTKGSCFKAALFSTTPLRTERISS
jgi:hypothetical protein